MMDTTGHVYQTYYIYRDDVCLGSISTFTSKAEAIEQYAMYSEIPEGDLIARTALERQIYLNDILRADEDRIKANAQERKRDTR